MYRNKCFIQIWVCKSARILLAQSKVKSVHIVFNKCNVVISCICCSYTVFKFRQIGWDLRQFDLQHCMNAKWLVWYWKLKKRCWLQVIEEIELIDVFFIREDTKMRDLIIFHFLCQSQVQSPSLYVSNKYVIINKGFIGNIQWTFKDIGQDLTNMLPGSHVKRAPK